MSAGYLGRSVNWLKKQKGALFKEGVHYFHPVGVSDTYWDVEAIDSWVRSENIDEISNILKRVL